MTRRATWPVRVHLLSLGGAFAALLVGSLMACSTPPIGWQGAGRMQSLPAPQPDSGGPMGDAGAGSGSPGPDPGGVVGPDPRDAGADGDAS
jgi:hypothetical protein